MMGSCKLIRPFGRLSGTKLILINRETNNKRYVKPNIIKKRGYCAARQIASRTILHKIQKTGMETSYSG